MTIARMVALFPRWIFSVLLAGICLLSSDFVSAADKPELKGQYKKPTINQRMFGEDLAMVGTERDDYATNLAAYAVKEIRENGGNQDSLDLARKVLGLGLHLSPRNKKSLVVNAQLARGILPEPVVGDYDPDVFARLLLARGQLLEKREGEANMLVARYLIALAAIIDPRNEDAIYESEIRRIDHGEISWTKLTDAKVNRVPRNDLAQPNAP